MWLLLIIICLSASISNAEPDDIPVVAVDVFRNQVGELVCSGHSLVLAPDAHFQVFINYAGDIYQPRCYEYFYAVHETKGFRKAESAKRPGYVSTTSTNNYTGIWSYICEFYSQRCENTTRLRSSEINELQCYHKSNGTFLQTEPTSCHAIIYIVQPDDISSEPTGFLTVNAANFTSNAGVPVSEYTYYYYDGEPTNFTCHRSTGGFLELSYQDIEAQIGFKVNGLVLPPTRHERAGARHEYRYFHGEGVTVDLVNRHFRDSLDCTAEGFGVPDDFIYLFNTNSGPPSFPIHVRLNGGHSHTTLRCIVTTKQVFPRLISLTFVYYLPASSPFINGLSMSKILLAYSNTTTNTIQYSYTRNEKLTLSCEIDVASATKWLYAPEAVITAKDYLDTFERTQWFQLDSDRNSTLITCLENTPTPSGKLTYLELIRAKGGDDFEDVTTRSRHEITEVGSTGADVPTSTAPIVRTAGSTTTYVPSSTKPVTQMVGSTRADAPSSTAPVIQTVGSTEADTPSLTVPVVHTTGFGGANVPNSTATLVQTVGSIEADMPSSTGPAVQATGSTTTDLPSSTEPVVEIAGSTVDVSSSSGRKDQKNLSVLVAFIILSRTAAELIGSGVAR